MAWDLKEKSLLFFTNSQVIDELKYFRDVNKIDIEASYLKDNIKTDSDENLLKDFKESKIIFLDKKESIWLNIQLARTYCRKRTQFRLKVWREFPK